MATDTTGDNLDEIEPPEHTLDGPQHFALSAYWFGTNLHWGAWLMIVMPSQVAHIAPQSKAQAQGIIVSCGMFAALIVPLVVGALSDRCTSPWGRRRPYMAIGVAINLIGLAVLFAAGNIRSLWLYVVGYIVIQLGNNIATGSYTGLIPDLVPEYERGVASGWMAAMSQLGTIVGVVAAGQLMGKGMVGASYIVIAASLTLFLCISLFGVRERPLTARPPKIHWLEFLRSLWFSPRQYPDFWWVCITRGLVVMGLWCVQQYMQYFLADTLGVENPEKSASYILGLGLICATVTAMYGGKISDKVGRKLVVYVSNGVIAAATLAFVFAHSLTAAFIFGALFGLGYGAYYSVDWALGCDVLPSQDDAAKGMAFWHVFMVFPQAIALPIAGMLLSAFGHSTSSGPDGAVVHYTHAGYTALFAMAAFFLILGAALLRNVRGVR